MTFFVILAVLAFILILKALSKSSKKKEKIYYTTCEPKIQERVIYKETEPKDKWEKRSTFFIIVCAFIALIKYFKENKN